MSMQRRLFKRHASISLNYLPARCTELFEETHDRLTYNYAGLGAQLIVD